MLSVLIILINYDFNDMITIRGIRLIINFDEEINLVTKANSFAIHNPG